MRSKCLAGARICTTGIGDPLKSQLRASVEAMGGEFVVNLDDSVTHLVAETVGSPKYKVRAVALCGPRARHARAPTPP